MNDSDENLKYCPHCGTKIDRKASFCFACGSELEEGAEVEPEKGEPASKVAQKMERDSAKIEDKKEKKFLTGVAFTRNTILLRAS